MISTFAVATFLLEASAIEYGDEGEFRKKANHIMVFIQDPGLARNSLMGDRPTSIVYDVYEMFFGKWYEAPMLNMLMAYEICYFVLRKKSPLGKGEMHFVEAYTAAYIDMSDYF